MDLFNREQLRELTSRQADPSVSLYMPAFRFESDVSQNKIRYKNLLHEAEQELREHGQSSPEIDELLEPARALLEDEAYWHYQSDGLAVFVSPEYFQTYRLPIHFEELVSVGQRFHVKPLFPILATNNTFYILALSQNSVKLYQGTHYAISEVEVEDMPESIEDALFYDDEEQSLQEHTGARVGSRHDSIRHAHGTQSDDNRHRPKDEIRRFLRDIDNAIQPALGDERAPLLLAGVEYYLPLFRDVNSYTNFIDDAIVSGNPDRVSPKELHEAAWAIMEPRFQAHQEESIERFQQLIGNGDGLASDDMHEVVPAAVFSRVDTLFVPIGEHLWGRYDEDSNTVVVHSDRQPGDDDLLDLSAVHTYMNGGTVHALQRANMPVQSNLAATFRFKADVAATER